MKKRSLVVLVLVPLVLGFPDASPACSFGPDLFELSGRAELIALIRIEAIDGSPKPPEVEWDENADHFEEDAVVLRVLETWKGPSMSEVRMQVYSVGADYKVGDVMLVFLQQGPSPRDVWEPSAEVLASLPPDVRENFEKGLTRERRHAAWAVGRWFSAGSVSDTVAFPREQDVAAIKDLVLAAARMQSGGTVDPQDRRDWFVTAAERRITRNEGLTQLRWELAPPTIPPFEANMEESEAEAEPDAEEPEDEDAVESASEPLTKDQLSRLAAGFASEPAVDASDASMLRLLASYPDLEVDRTAASVVEAGLLLRPIPGWVTEIVELTLARYGDVFADRLGRDDVDKEGRPIYTGEGENTLPTIWEVARRELGIPSVLPAQAPARPTSDRYDQAPD